MGPAGREGGNVSFSTYDAWAISSLQITGHGAEYKIGTERKFWLCFDVYTGPQAKCELRTGRKHARSNEHSLGVLNLHTRFVSTVLLDSKV